MHMDAQGKKILLVEDDQMLRDMLLAHMSQDYAVEIVGDGKQALERLESLRPDAVILDLMIPGMNGFDVLMHIRELKDEVLAKVPVVVLSNLKDPESVMRAQQYGIQAYLPKADINLNTLSVQLKKVVR